LFFEEATVYEQTKKYLEYEKNFTEIVEHEDERMFKDFCLLLGAGEASSIILAMQKKLPLIIDEKKGRAFAKRMNIKVIGLIGIIQYLYTEEKISFERCNTILKKLEHSDFRISQKLIDLVLEK
jgi:predicted nucleic acid-binding protein